MKALPRTPALLEVAAKVVWFKEPADALDDPRHFLTYVMRYGTGDDVVALGRAGIGVPEFLEVLDNPLPGVFDQRSWYYWNYVCGRRAVPPLPVRALTSHLLHPDINPAAQ